MRIADSEWIPATRHQTWDALLDPAVLQKCLPGCVTVTRTSPTEYHFALHTRVGGLEADYEGELLMSDIQAPESCTVAFEGKGAAAGMAIGTAQINLAQKEQGTRLTYTIAAMAGGQLAQCGQRALAGAAEKILTRFLANFTEHMAALAPTPYHPPPEPESTSSRHPMMTWIIPILIVAGLMGYHTFFK